MDARHTRTSAADAELLTPRRLRATARFHDRLSAAKARFGVLGDDGPKHARDAAALRRAADTADGFRPCPTCHASGFARIDDHGLPIPCACPRGLERAAAQSAEEFRVCEACVGSGEITYTTYSAVYGDRGSDVLCIDCDACGLFCLRCDESGVNCGCDAGAVGAEDRHV